MAEQPRDDRHRHAVHHRVARVCVPQVMKSDVLQAGTGADAAPGALQVSNMGTRQSVGDHPRVAISTV